MKGWGRKALPEPPPGGESWLERIRENIRKGDANWTALAERGFATRDGNTPRLGRNVMIASIDQGLKAGIRIAGILAIAGLVGLLSMPAMAQGSGSTGGGGGDSSAGFPAPDPFTVTRTVEGSVDSITESGVLTVRRETGSPVELKLAAKVRIRTDKKSSFQGRKDVALKEITAGMPVRVLYRQATLEVLEIRVLKPSAKAKG